jgi:hypothetical protein
MNEGVEWIISYFLTLYINERGKLAEAIKAINALSSFAVISPAGFHISIHLKKITFCFKIIYNIY